MPEPQALSARGGWLVSGDALATPVIAGGVLTEKPTLRAKHALTGAALVLVDLLTGTAESRTLGDVADGQELDLGVLGPMTLVVVGAFVGDMPFEGFTTFLRKTSLSLALEVPKQVRPREEIRIAVTAPADSDRPVTVLVCVRDERLTATDTPAAALGSALKRAVTRATEGMDDGFQELVEQVQPAPYMMARAAVRMAACPPAPRRPPPAASLAGPERLHEAARPSVARGRPLAPMNGLAAPDFLEYESLGSSTPTAEPEPARVELAEVLFYDLVEVRGRKEIAFFAGDSLGSFAVEAFALGEGDWTSTRATLVVDQPVRADLDLPPAVFPGD